MGPACAYILYKELSSKRLSHGAAGAYHYQQSPYRHQAYERVERPEDESHSEGDMDKQLDEDYIPPESYYHPAEDEKVPLFDVFHHRSHGGYYDPQESHHREAESQKLFRAGGKRDAQQKQLFRR